MDGLIVVYGCLLAHLFAVCLIFVDFVVFLCFLLFLVAVRFGTDRGARTL